GHRRDLHSFPTRRSSDLDSASGELLQEEDEEEGPEASSNPAVRMVAAIYWPVATAIYLGWSFLSGDWDVTWVVWPIAGVLYAGLDRKSTRLNSSHVKISY